MLCTMAQQLEHVLEVASESQNAVPLTGDSRKPTTTLAASDEFELADLPGFVIDDLLDAGIAAFSPAWLNTGTVSAGTGEACIVIRLGSSDPKHDEFRTQVTYPASWWNEHRKGSAA